VDDSAVDHFPDSHALQLEEPEAETAPHAHEEQASTEIWREASISSSARYRPAGHMVQNTYPALLYLPEAQTSHASKLPPAFLLLFPAGQSMHSSPEVELYWPVSHDEQDEA
jgi:hypothetical protein